METEAWKYSVDGLVTGADGKHSVRHICDCASYEEAVTVSKQVIDDFLKAWCIPGMTAERLFVSYCKRGEIPIVFIEGANTMNLPVFNHYAYAKERCAALCKSG